MLVLEFFSNLLEWIGRISQPAQGNALRKEIYGRWKDRNASAAKIWLAKVKLHAEARKELEQIP
jgi:hypothetical protein